MRLRFLFYDAEIPGIFRENTVLSLFPEERPGRPKENTIRNFEKGRIPRQLDLLARFLFDMEQN